MKPGSGQTPALIQADPACRPVAFLAIDNVYNNPYALLEFMDSTYTDWGIITDGVTWSLFSRTVSAPAERCCTAALPRVPDAGDMDARRFMLLFSALGHTRGGAADRLLAQSLDARRRTAARVAQAADAAILALCRGFIRAEQAATGAAPAGPGLLMILRHALLLCERCLLLLYAEARGALPMHDARYERNSLTRWIERAAAPAARCKPGAHPVFSLWPGLNELFESAWRGDKATGAQSMACEFLDPAAHPFLQYNSVDDCHLQQAAEALHEACCAHPAQFADCDAADLALALEPLAHARLALAAEPMLLVLDGDERLWLPAKKVKWMQVLERIGPGQAFLDRVPEPTVARSAASPAAMLRTADLALRGNSASLFDPVCGSGLVLIRAASTLAARAAAKNTSVSYMQHKRRALEACIAGSDPDAFTAEIARFCLTLSCLDPGLPPPVLSHRVRSGNALLAIGSGEWAKDADRDFADQLQALGRDARALPLMPDASYGEAKRRCEVSKRIAARTGDLAARAGAPVPGATSAPATSGRMQNPDCARSPLHPEIAFPGEFGPDADLAGFGCLAVAAPRNIALRPATRAWLASMARAAGPPAPAHIIALRLVPFTAPGATAAILVRESFLRTKKAAELHGPDGARAEHFTREDADCRGYAVLLISK